MNKKQRRIYQLATEVIRQKLTIREFSIVIGKYYRQARRIVTKVRQRERWEFYMGIMAKCRTIGQVIFWKTSSPYVF